MADLYEVLRGEKRLFLPDDIKGHMRSASQERVEYLAEILQKDLSDNLPRIYDRRKGLPDYRTNPYVMLATANIMGLSDPVEFANFLFNSKLAMGLETSFGKIVERAFVVGYPCGNYQKWSDPEEKLAEFFAEKQAEGRAAKAAVRNKSVWREIDKEVTVGDRRYLTSIKSGPNTINDTQVQGMADAIVHKHEEWWRQSKEKNPDLEGLDIVVGLTYGTEKSTNNKDNQILAKLIGQGFVEEDQSNMPGVLVDEATRRIRVYRRVGQGFWSWIGNPASENENPQVFVEILLALTIALDKLLQEGSSVEEGINYRLATLAKALMKMKFAKDSLPDWVAQDVSSEQLFWFATAISSFFDEGV